MTRRAFERRQRVALLLLVLALVGLAAWVAPRLFVLFDEAYNLSVSLNLAQRGVYATHANGRDAWFDPAVSTGPVVLAPLALALRLGGVSLTVTRTTMLAFFVASVLLAGWGARQLLGGRWPAVSFVTVLVATPLVLEFGLCVMGDVPAIALAVAGFGLLQRGETGGGRHVPRLLLAGVAFGLAALCKDIMLLLLPGLVLGWLATGGGAPLRSERDARWLAPAAMAVACVFAWRGGQWLVVRSLFTPDAAAAWSDGVAAAQRRLWQSVSFSPLSHPLDAWRISVEYFAPVLCAVALTALAAMLARRRVGAPAETTSYAWTSLLAAAGVWFFWFYLVSGPAATHRHLLPGLVLAELIVMRALRRWFAAGSRQERAAAAALALCLTWSVLHGVGYLRLYLASSEPRLAMQQNAARWVQANAAPGAPLYGWGWYVPWHVAFLAQRPAASIDPAAPAAATTPALFVLSPEIAWSGQRDGRVEAFLQRLGPAVVDQRLYPVYIMRP